MKKVAYLAENFGAFPRGTLSSSTVMHQSGHNVGNFAFWNASRLLFDGELRLFGFGSNAANVPRDKVDFVVIPAANYLNATADLGGLAELIRQLDRPCVVFGLGAQSEDEKVVPALKPGTVEFLREAAARTPYLAVRGAFSKQVCEANGVGNVRVMGCPSIFTNGDRKLGSKIQNAWARPIDKLAIHASSMKTHVRHAERVLFQQLAVHQGSSYVIQRPVELMKAARGEALNEADEKYIKFAHDFLAPDLSRASFLRTLRASGVVPFSIDSWLFHLAGHSHSVGTRIHGAVLSLSAELPSVCITHDTRTRELSQVLKVPNVDCSEVKKFSSLSELLASQKFDGEVFEDNRSALARGFVALLQEVGLGASKYLREKF
jgi:hypothetical protein